jgi:hypothetical protein
MDSIYIFRKKGAAPGDICWHTTVGNHRQGEEIVDLVDPDKSMCGQKGDTDDMYEYQWRM